MEKEKKKRAIGRPKKNSPKKYMPIAAVNWEPIEFIGFYPTTNNAATVLFDQVGFGTRIRMCADGEVLKIKNMTFLWVDDSQGLTTETIREVIEKAKRRKNNHIKIPENFVDKLSNPDYEIFLKLIEKYT